MTEPDSDPRLGLPSASKLALVVACPGQDNLYRQLVQEFGQLESGEDTYAQFGTAVHLSRQTGNTLNLDEEQSAAYDRGMAFEQQIVAQWARDNGIEHYQEGEREERLFIHDPHTLEPVASAQLDVQYIGDGGHVCVIDWKALYAYRTPAAPKNWQGRLQAVAKWRDVDGITKIRFALNRCQAKVGGEDYCDYLLTDLENSEQAIHWHLWLSRQPDAPLNAGPHCFHCPCRAHCPTAAGYSMLPGAVATKNFTLQEKPEQLVQRLSPEDLLKLWDADSTVRAILDAVDARLKTLPKEELERLGLELPEQGRSRDTVIDVPGAFLFLRDAQGFSEEKLWGILRLTKGDVAKLAMAEKQLAKKWADKWSTDTLAAFSLRTHDQPSLRRIKGM